MLGLNLIHQKNPRGFIVMEENLSMLESLDRDTLWNIFRCLDEPADLVRFAAVSRSCQRIVVESRCVKDLCVRISPEVSMFNSMVEENKRSIHKGPSSSADSEFENLKREHRVYAMLLHELMGPPLERSCIYNSICASSTDNYPEESIINTLDPRPREFGRACYWSSKGESNTEVPETLTYALHTKLCVVHEVKIRPFQAYFQRGAPIYSSNAVRFRFGYSSLWPRSNISLVDRFMSSSRSACQDYVWTYVSEEYPMQQEDKLQTFKLPRPVLCIGDIFQVELLGRVQKQETDGLYYICVCHVHVVARPLYCFNFSVLVEPRQLILKYLESQEPLGMLSEDTSRVTSEDNVTGTYSRQHSTAGTIRHFRARKLLTILASIGMANFFSQNDQDSDEEDSNTNSDIY